MLTAVARRRAAESASDLIHPCSCLLIGFWGFVGLLVFILDLEFWFLLTCTKPVSTRKGPTLSISKPGPIYQRGVCVVFKHGPETQAESSPACHVSRLWWAVLRNK